MFYFTLYLSLDLQIDSIKKRIPVGGHIAAGFTILQN
jgi:hypothetical protein